MVEASEFRKVKINAWGKWRNRSPSRWNPPSQSHWRDSAVPEKNSIDYNVYECWLRYLVDISLSTRAIFADIWTYLKADKVLTAPASPGGRQSDSRVVYWVRFIFRTLTNELDREGGWAGPGTGKNIIPMDFFVFFSYLNIWTQKHPNVNTLTFLVDFLRFVREATH